MTQDIAWSKESFEIFQIEWKFRLGMSIKQFSYLLEESIGHWTGQVGRRCLRRKLIGAKLRSHLWSLVITSWFGRNSSHTNTAQDALLVRKYFIVSTRGSQNPMIQLGSLKVSIWMNRTIPLKVNRKLAEICITCKMSIAHSNMYWWMIWMIS